MVKGTRNTRINTSRDILKCYAKLYNRVDNGLIEDKKARLLLAILNGMTNSYKVLELEEQCEELAELVKQIKGEI